MNNKKELHLGTYEDELRRAMQDMDREHPARKLLHKLALEIGDYFNVHHQESHIFGLASNESPTPEGEKEQGE